MTVYTVVTSYGMISHTEQMDAPYLESWIKFLEERHEVCEVKRDEVNRFVEIRFDRPRCLSTVPDKKGE
jgi:hypothetical protein